MDKPRKYQTEAIDMIARIPNNFLLGDDPGLGKSCIALLSTLKYNQYPVLVVTPKKPTVKLTQIELPKWAKDLSYEILQSRTPYSISNAKIVFINYDILAAWADEILQHGFKYVIFDEAHYLSNHTSQRTQAAFKITHTFAPVLKKYRPDFEVETEKPKTLLMTATPLRRKPKTLFPLMAILFNTVNTSVTTDYWAYAKRYCNLRMKRIGHRRIQDDNGASNLDELRQILHLSGVYLRRQYHEVQSELPAQLFIAHKIELDKIESKKYKKIQDEIEDVLKVKLDSEELTEEAFNKLMKVVPMVKYKYLVDVITEVCYRSITEEVNDILDNTTEKVLIFGHHIKHLDRLSQLYGNLCISNYGDIKEEGLDIAFQNNPSKRVYVGGIKSGSTGVDLDTANHIFLLELPQSIGELKQILGRVRRGRDNGTTYVHIPIPEGTLQDRFIKNLAYLDKIASKVVDGASGVLASELLNLI